MDWADDVAYSVHDVEDGVHSGHIRLPALADDGRAGGAVRAGRPSSTRRCRPAELAPVLDALLRAAAAARSGRLRRLLRRAGGGQAGHQRADRPVRRAPRSAATRRAVTAPGRSAATGADLVVPERVAAECALLKAIAFRYVMRRRGVRAAAGTPAAGAHRAGRGAVRARRAGAVAGAAASPGAQAGDDAERLRVVVDQVAQLTDSAALAWHDRLLGLGRTPAAAPAAASRLDSRSWRAGFATRTSPPSARRPPIADVIGEHVQLRNAGGGNLKGICPFHDEKSPSLSVSPARNLFHCFGCGAGGDVIRFVERIEHLSFTEAVESLAGRAGIQLRYAEGGTGPQPAGRAAGPAGRGAHAGGGVLRRAAAHARRPQPAREFLDRARLRRGGGDAVRLRLRPGRLGRADQVPARPRLQPGRADPGRAVPASPAAAR